MGEAVEDAAAPGHRRGVILQAQGHTFVEAGRGAVVRQRDRDDVFAGAQQLLHVIDRGSSSVARATDPLAIDEDRDAAVDLAEPKFNHRHGQVFRGGMETRAKHPFVVEPEWPPLPVHVGGLPAGVVEFFRNLGKVAIVGIDSLLVAPAVDGQRTRRCGGDKCVRLVGAWVAVAYTENAARAFELEANGMVRHRNHAALRIDHRHRDDGDILAVGIDPRPVGV